MDKKLEYKVSKAIDELIKISGDLSELQDTFNDLILQAYDDGVEEGYNQRVAEDEVKP